MTRLDDRLMSWWTISNRLGKAYQSLRWDRKYAEMIRLSLSHLLNRSDHQIDNCVDSPISNEVAVCASVIKLGTIRMREWPPFEREWDSEDDEKPCCLVPDPFWRLVFSLPSFYYKFASSSPSIARNAWFEKSIFLFSKTWFHLIKWKKYSNQRGGKNYLHLVEND